MEVSGQRHATVTVSPIETLVHIELGGWALQPVRYLRGTEKYFARTDRSNSGSSSR